MRISALVAAIFLASLNAYGDTNLNVVYPKANQQIALVDSTFIFGSVTPGSHLSINGIDIPVHKAGGWLGFLAISPGKFDFHIVARRGNDSTVLDWPIMVGAPDTTAPAGIYIPKNPRPGTKAIYFTGDTFEFSFEAPPGGRGWFRFDDCESIKMFESNQADGGNPSSVFGAIPSDSSRNKEKVRYIGYYRFEPADTGIHKLCYLYTNERQSSGENPVVPEQCLDSLITVLPEFPPLIGILSGQNQIIRNAPAMGYKLLYQPPGIIVQITGMRDNFYKLKLATDIPGYVNVDSVTLLPPGTAVPEGNASYITVDSTGDGIRVALGVGMKLPYEINEDLSPQRLDVDIFGVIGSVDWIRYNTKNPLIKIVKWSQPQDHVFRLTVEIGNGRLWGYKAFYEDTKFILIIREEPKLHGSLSKRLKGLKVAIDPGHSQDPGAIGPTGLLEKDANLWIAHKLRVMLEARGAKVLMTRYGHENVSLYDRPLKADKWGADLLISIHNNALPDGINPFYNKGTSVYYYFPHSKALAETIHNAMLKRTGLPDHGLYYGNLVLPRYNFAPAVLVECTFMIIPGQEALLKTASFQKKCARAILDGITDYIAQKE